MKSKQRLTFSIESSLYKHNLKEEENMKRADQGIFETKDSDQGPESDTAKRF